MAWGNRLILDYVSVGTVILTILVAALTLTGFWTSSWLVVDSEMHPEMVPSFRMLFHKIGLWEICFRMYQNTGNPYQRYSVMCDSVIVNTNPNYRNPDFMLATQVLYSTGMGVVIIATVLMVVMLACGATRKIIFALGGCFLFSGFSICLADIVFAACAFEKEGLFGWTQSNILGWTFWVAVASGCSLWLLGTCYFIVAYRLDRVHHAQFTKYIL
ncbi:uncharacterized protein LOC129599101 [Paramacrobiotus metropolitanus]|uniref:uncharacterized protein LOC129599101 n=1 Tax=Paramacrobiotus metropolitanus TaxID=2943436 RepID=UPI002445C84B|nr:uncharacterized protein LOC129599101 [Paramacrobiotus metropolitanus]